MGPSQSTNWLSFEMFSSSSSSLLDTFYSPGWDNPPRHHFPFTDQGQEPQHGELHLHHSNPHLLPNPSPVLYPKLEDFLNSFPTYHPTSFAPVYNLGDIAAATEGFTPSSSLPFNSKPEANESSCSPNATSSSLTNTGSLTLGVRDPPKKIIARPWSSFPGAAVGWAPVRGREIHLGRGLLFTAGSPGMGTCRHRWTGRYEAHLWDNSCRREGQARKGRQGGYDKEDKAARAYDLAALKYWGPTATTNFPVSTYIRELEEMKLVTKQEFIASLRRHHQQGRWQARIGRVAGNKDLYLGTFATEEEAAEAYDIAAIKFRGLNAVTNFEISRYDMEAIARSSLPVGGTAKRLKLEPDLKPSIALEQLPQSGIVSGISSNIGLSLVQPFSAMIPSRKPFETSPSIHHQSFFHHLQQQSGNSIYPSGMVTMIPAPAPASSLTHAADFFLWPNQSY
ncbi:hypothetical protein MLD38_005022 [Melastoma candidum]|uniref:Uncharacterized protein n=1 Tax=Melastoma candidum TaxID=119954 RepID=A0ACB9SG60_9MYRT|nr:hypothetical protein MLD38_005022 [Melastoma candidum]